MTDKERQNQRRRTEDAAFNRMLLWLLGAVVAELIILLVKHFYVDMTGESMRAATMADRTAIRKNAFVPSNGTRFPCNRSSAML